MRMALTNPNNAPGLIRRLEPPLGNPVPGNIPSTTPEIDIDDYVLLSNDKRGDFQRDFPGDENFSLNELKSWSNGPSFDLMTINDQFKSQLRAFFGNENVQSMSNMNYYFDGRKLVGEGRPFSSADEAVTYIRQKFRAVFIEAVDGQSVPANGFFEEIWNRFDPTLRQSLFGNLPEEEARQAFVNMAIVVEDPNNVLYSFIKVVYDL